MKRVFLIAPFVVIALLVGIWVAGNGAEEEFTPVLPERTGSATPKPTPLAVSTDISRPGHDEGIERLNRRYPAIRHLPHETMYWLLQLDGGPKEGRLQLRATVYVIPQETEESAEEKQRPFIEAYLDSIGQVRGTYDLEVKTERIDSY